MDHSIQLMQRTGTPFPVVLFHINDQPRSSKTWYSNSFSKANQTSLTKASWYNHSTAYAPLKFWLSMPIWSLHQNENLVRLRPDAWYGTITFCPEPKGRKNSNANTTQIILKMRKYWETRTCFGSCGPSAFQSPCCLHLYNNILFLSSDFWTAKRASSMPPRECWYKS